MQWHSKRLQSRGSSFRNGSESGGQLLECTGRGRKTNKQKDFKPLGNLTFLDLMLKIQLLLKQICHKK
jgi:hypothetical protein